MKRKIHKKDREIVQRIYDVLVFFCTHYYIQTPTCTLWNVKDNRNGRNYSIHAYYSHEFDDIPILTLNRQEEVMLRLYNIVLDASALLGEKGQMDTFLGVPPIEGNSERHIWIKIFVIEE